jgi:SAM-dependent methyltransferase
MSHYKGLMIGCAPGTHEVIAQLIVEHVPHRAGVIDLGAGSGALLARLRDAGFSDLYAADLAAENFGLKGVPHQRVDLNTDFSTQFDRTFSVICLSEVIEHLDSPRHFFREAYNLLDDDGFLVVSLPNVAFWEGRLKFLLSGELWGFGERHYRGLRHISPMTFDMMRLTMQEMGFQVTGSATAGSFATPLRSSLLLPLWLPVRLVGGRRSFGECAIFVARKTSADAELAAPTVYRDVWQRSAGEGSCVRDA